MPMHIHYIHLKGRSRCFVLDGQLEVAKFSKRQNQSVQKTPSVCMCPITCDYPKDSQHYVRHLQI